jgi:FecR protein
MKGNYLWDASGEPDPDIQRLEKMLGRFRHRMPALSLDEFVPRAERERVTPMLRMLFMPRRLAAAAVIAIAALTAASLSFRSPYPSLDTRGLGGWKVIRVDGMPRIGSRAIGAREVNGRLDVGQTLETGRDGRASIAVAGIGQLDVEPETRLRLLETSAGHKRIALDRGTIHAAIWAAPGEFVVETPSAVAVDLGCMYTLEVNDAGDGILRTTLGWVGFQRDGRESFIPAGAMCVTHADFGPGTPYLVDASEAFRSALLQLDGGSASPAARKAALLTVLREARAADGLTLWHLFSRVAADERSTVYDRLTVLVPPPGDVTRAGVLRLDPQMLDAWWNVLGFGDISVWRHWERSWTDREEKAKPVR